MRQKLTSSRRLNLVIGAIALLLIPVTLTAVFFVMRTEFAQVRELRSTTEQALVTRDELKQFLIGHIDAETAVRGYVVSQNPAFLEPFNSAQRERARLLDNLERTLEPELVPQLVQLHALSNRRLKNLQANIDDVQSGRADRARERIASGTGKRMMDELRERVATLDEFELTKVRRLTAAGTGSRNDVEYAVNGMLGALGLLLFFVAFITARSLSARKEALARSNQLARRKKAMFDGAVDPTLLLDAKGNILRMNPSVVRLFGYSEKDLVGKHNMLLMDDEYTPEQSQTWLMSVGEAGEHGAGKRQEFTGLRKDGTTFETEVAISRLGGDGETQYIAAIRDITHRKRAEQLKTEFVSTVSHELRTPLTSISGSLGLLSAGAVGALDEKAQRLVTIAHSNCERLIRLINDILDIEKIESGKMEFDLRRMQVAPLIHRTVSSIRGFADQHGVTVSVELPPWPQCIVGDPDRLEQLLTNLVSNAIKHSPESGTVELFARQESGNIRIEVRDRGSGIPISFRERIFGKFAMADASDSRTKSGTGLGLSIAREIARRHGGDVGFHDRKGGGTVFFATIPVVRDDPVMARTDEANSELRILHVDDDFDCLNVVASAFGGRAVVVSAGSLQQARELIESEDFDAAIIDVDMRSEDGLDLIPLLKTRRPSLPILLFTALDAAYAETEADKVLVKSRSSVNDLVEATVEIIDGGARKVA